MGRKPETKVQNGRTELQKQIGVAILTADDAGLFLFRMKFRKNRRAECGRLRLDGSVFDGRVFQPLVGPLPGSPG